MPVSIREVAERAGVSRGTVSSVLNGKTEARIAVRTQQHVRQIAEEMGYRPNHLARSLGRRRTDTIGLMIGDLRNPYFVELLEAAEDTAFEAGYDVMLDNAYGRRAATGRSGRLHNWPVDGVLMWTVPDESVASYLGSSALSLPVVYLGYARDDNESYVAYDIYAGARAAMNHLIERGRKRIAFLYPGSPESSVHAGEARYAAYCDACRRFGLASNTIGFAETGNIAAAAARRREGALSAGLEIARMPLEKRPDAVFCHNDVVALGLCSGLARAGVRVPHEIAVVGFDGIADGQAASLPLTTVRCPVQPMCAKALGLLRDNMSPTELLEPAWRQVVLEPELICGATS